MAKRRAGATNDYDQVQEQIMRERDEAIARIKQEASDRLREIAREKQAREARERARQRKVRQGMAYALGEYLMRNFDSSGFNDPVVEALIASDGFDAFMRAPRLRGRRAAFGLTPLADSTKPEGKPAAK